MLRACLLQFVYCYFMQLFEEHIKRNQENDIRKPRETMVSMEKKQPVPNYPADSTTAAVRGFNKENKRVIPPVSLPSMITCANHVASTRYESQPLFLTSFRFHKNSQHRQLRLCPQIMIKWCT